MVEPELAQHGMRFALEALVGEFGAAQIPASACG